MITKKQINNLPNDPGVYRYYDKNQKLIYIGKAKNLKKRIQSYFNKKHFDLKTINLVNNIENIDYIITSNEIEALILELNLISKHKPKYNVLLKDDRSFHYLTITKENHPKIKIVNKITNYNNKYFGPYKSLRQANLILKNINRVINLRKCNKIPNKACIYYYIDNCYAPCILKKSRKEITKEVELATKLLSKNKKIIKEIIEPKIENLSKKQEYELAAEYKEIYEILTKDLFDENLSFKEDENFDILYAFEKNNLKIISYFFIRNGKVIESFNKSNNDSKIDLESFSFSSYFNEKLSNKNDIYTNLNIKINNLNIKNPQKGKKFKLLEIAKKNVNKLHKEILKEEEKWKTIKDFFYKICQKEIEKIEIYDNSHYQGQNNTSYKLFYDKFNIISNNQRRYSIDNYVSDDQTFIEVINRRLNSQTDLDFPDLILLDGGKIQVDMVKKHLAKDLLIMGLTKDKSHKTSKIYYNNKYYEIDNKEVMIYLSNMQEEIHKRAISYTKLVKNKKDIINNFKDNKEIRNLLNDFDDIKEIIDQDFNYLKEKYKITNKDLTELEILIFKQINLNKGIYNEKN